MVQYHLLDEMFLKKKSMPVFEKVKVKCLSKFSGVDREIISRSSESDSSHLTNPFNCVYLCMCRDRHVFPRVKDRNDPTERAQYLRPLVCPSF